MKCHTTTQYQTESHKIIHHTLFVDRSLKKKNVWSQLGWGGLSSPSPSLDPHLTSICINPVSSRLRLFLVVLWVGLSSALKTMLYTCQNKVIRYVLGIPPRAHVGAHEFGRLHWLPVEKRVQQIALVHTYIRCFMASSQYICPNNCSLSLMCIPT